MVTARAWEGAWQAACEALRWVDSEKLRGLFVSTIVHALPTAESPGLREAIERARAERWGTVVLRGSTVDVRLGHERAEPRGRDYRRAVDAEVARLERFLVTRDPPAPTVS